MNKMITILGPTASGKTSLATALAADINGEILSADSRQVYRDMNIGTGKDLEDYVVDGKHIPYHIIDIVEPGTKYNLFRFQEDFTAAYNDISAKGGNAILCGGSGLYIEAVLKGYSLSPVPQNKELRSELADKSLAELADILSSLKVNNRSNMHNTSDVDTTQRAIRAIEIETYNMKHNTDKRQIPSIDSLIIGVNINRDLRRRKISERLKQRLDNGMIEEISSLLDKGIPAESLIYYGLEYKYVTEYVMGKTTYNEMFNGLEIAIHQFAKRQMTWFRGMERRGFNINWIDVELPINDKINKIKELWP